MSAQVAADLRAAAEVLRRDGWTQDDYVAEDGRKCAVGALLEVVDADALAADDIDGLDERLIPHKLAFRRATGVLPLGFNDTPGRTADEVIAALEAAADAAEAVTP